MKVLSVTAEMQPLVKTGGLADVTGTLPPALAPHGVDMRVLLPAYRGLLARLAQRAAPVSLDLPLGHVRLHGGKAGKVAVWLLDMPELFDRPGGPYLDADGRDHPDNWRRFAVLAQAAAWLARDGVQGWTPDLVHGHDWHAGLTGACLRADDCPVPYVQTIHNIAFTGQFPAEIFPQLGLPARFFTAEWIKFYGDVSFLKAGLAFADAITTVSPTYAEELTRPDFGGGFHGLLRARAAAFTGILNGIDTGEWDPGSDALIPCHYGPRRLARRGRNRQALDDEFSLEAGRPLVAVISRLTDQKGIDLVLAATAEIVALGFDLLILGTGQPDIEAQAQAAARHYPGRVGVHIGFDEALAHRIQAGADALLIPSRFEPCGLTQLCALRYGCLPVVAPTGGLADTVIDASPAALAAGVATGFHLRELSPAGIAAALARLQTVLQDRRQHWRMMRNAMAADVSWDASARAYAALYAGLIAGAAADSGAGAPAPSAP